MRKLLMKMSISVDGFVSGPNGENDWISDKESLAYSVGAARQAGLLIMGKKSFEVMAPYWPVAKGPFVAPTDEKPKALFTKKTRTNSDASFKTATTRTNKTNSKEANGVTRKANASLKEISRDDTRVFDGGLAEGIMQLKAEPGKPIVAVGGASFMRNLIATGLIDEYHLYVHPVVLGSGLPIFTGLEKPLNLKLVDIKPFAGGAVEYTYHPA